MSSFWLGCIALLLMAMVFLILPLLKKRDEISTEVDVKQNNILIFRERLAELTIEKQQGRLDAKSYQALKIELEKALLQDVSGQTVMTYDNQPLQVAQVVTVFSLVILVMLSSTALYLSLGRSSDLARFMSLPAQSNTSMVKHDPKQQKAPDFAKEIKMLKQHLIENPDDIDKYVLLANSYAALGNYRAMAQVYTDLAKQLGEQHSDYAAIKGSSLQALFQAEGEKFTPEIEAKMAEVLALDSEESTTLILSGMRAYIKGDYAQAITFWQKSKRKAVPEQKRRFIEPAIAEAQKNSGLVVEKTVSNNAKIVVNLSLDDKLKGLVKANDIIFVFARGAGSRMPLAAERLRVQDLPKQIILDDSKAAMPTAVLSSVKKVNIVARIALKGTPKAQRGDLFIEQENVMVNAGQVLDLVINQVQQ